MIDRFAERGLRSLAVAIQARITSVSVELSIAPYRLIRIADLACADGIWGLLLLVLKICRKYQKGQKKVWVRHGSFVAYCPCMIHPGMTVLKLFGMPSTLVLM